MRAYARWIGIGAAVGITSALVPVVQGRIVPADVAAPLARLTDKAAAEPAPPNFEGLTLSDLTVSPRRVTAPLAGGRTAELSVEPDLQTSTQAIMERYQIPVSGAVLMDVKTGRILVYASRVGEGAPYDVNVRALAPAASVFKVVTSAALIEDAGLSGGTEQCYRGGKSQILP